MRSIIPLYLVIGIVLLVIGYFATGPCPNKNSDVVNDVVFVLTWLVTRLPETLHRKRPALQRS